MELKEKNQQLKDWGKFISFNEKIIFEISFEVCNKVGGIYTVISSKAKYINSKFNNYFTIGILDSEINSNPKFLKEELPVSLKELKKELNSIGIDFEYGKWLIEGSPKTFLINVNNFYYKTNDLKKEFWENYKIDSLNTIWYDYDKPITWSYAVGIFIEKLSKKLLENNYTENIYIHSHEWLSGGANLYIEKIKKENQELENQIKTIFTTHATMLGRSLCGNGENLYQLIEKAKNEFIDFDSKAYDIGVQTKHQTEKTLATISNFFTTVSDLTGKEAEIFFNKKPDKILYNGLNKLEDNFDSLILNFNKSRETLINFTKKYFHNFYDFNIEDSNFGFSSGRFEFKNKGFDIIIPALSKINENLKKENSNKNLIFYIPILMGKYEKSKEIIESINNYNSNIQRKINLDFAPLSTHLIDSNNLLIQNLIKYNLKNHKDDKVKIIIIPANLNGTSNSFNFKYYDFIKGFDFSLFPSFYEPWGYTPEESISLGIKTLTSNIAGFGLYIKENYNEKISKEKTVSIINRSEDNFEQEVKQLYHKIYEYLNLTQKEELIIKENSYEFSKEFRWDKLIKNYLELYK